MTNAIAVDFKPLYIPFDYSFPPYKEYVPLDEIEKPVEKQEEFNVSPQES